MVLHSASRLGVLSYLYKQRHEIAYAVGIIAEVPMAMCNSDYHFTNDLVIVAAEDDAGTIPPAIVNAKEIQLFFVNTISIDSQRQISQVVHESTVIVQRYSPPALSIFHPPS